jgi:hypothetical protein
MDEEDLAFASVWGSSEPVIPPPPAKLDDFDDFGSPIETAQPLAEEDDDFGDFGDFGDDEQTSTGPGFGDSEEFGNEMPVAGPSSHADWEPLNLDPMPDREGLQEQVNHILAPIWGDYDISQVTTKEGIREVEGISQILVNPERYVLLSTVRTLVQHLIAGSFIPCFSNPHHL